MAGAENIFFYDARIVAATGTALSLHFAPTKRVLGSPVVLETASTAPSALQKCHVILTCDTPILVMRKCKISSFSVLIR
jgi:hypothetical protein